MPTSLSIKAADPDSSSRAFQWPVLESGNGSFENGVYSVTCDDKERGKSFSLEHEVRGAPLIKKWISENKLIFVCAVASPRSMYKVLHKAHSPQQSIEWKPEDLGGFPIFTPMMVARHEIKHLVEANPDGLNRIWDGKDLILPRGARVAIGPTFMFQSGINGLLDFNPDPDLENGRFRIEPSSEDGFKFKVYLAADLYSYLQWQRNEPTGMNVMVHIVSAALSCLRHDYSHDDDEEGWRSFPNLLGLADMLDEKKLPHWTDEDFKPEVVATGLYPHKLPTESVAQDDQP